MTVGTVFFSSQLLGYLIENVIDFRILWDNRKDLAKLPEPEENQWQ
jgi:hypothetical protein